MALTISNAAASAQADAVAAQLNSGYIRIYDGTRPATADTAVSTQTLLAELRFNATAFSSAVNGVATANAITEDSSANATGTATWFRVLTSDGTSVMFDGSVGATGSGADLELNTTSIVSGAAVQISAFTFTSPKS